MSPVPARAPAGLRFEHRWVEGGGRFTVRLHEQGPLLYVRLKGRGTQQALDVFLQNLEQCRDLLHPGEQVTALIHMGDVQGAPQRAQLDTGRWVLVQRHLTPRTRAAPKKPSSFQSDPHENRCFRFAVPRRRAPLR